MDTALSSIYGGRRYSQSGCTVVIYVLDTGGSLSGDRRCAGASRVVGNSLFQDIGTAGTHITRAYLAV